MLKSINPKTEYTYAIVGQEETVITYTAQSGAAMYAFSGDLLFNHMIDTCVTKITEIAIDMEVEVGTKEEPKTEVQCVEFKEFIPSEHKEVKLSKILPTAICNSLATRIWNISQISKVESGE